MKSKCCKGVVALILTIVVGAFALESLMALIGIAFATAIGHQAGMIISTFYTWPIYLLAVIAVIAIIIAKACGCCLKNSMCCQVNSKCDAPAPKQAATNKK